jgi:hypothetical protein
VTLVAAGRGTVRWMGRTNISKRFVRFGGACLRVLSTTCGSATPSGEWRLLDRQTIGGLALLPDVFDQG